MLAEAEELRRSVASLTPRSEKSHYGQFMTPASVASFMAGMFRSVPSDELHLLDPGAGIGALTCAFLDQLPSTLQNVSVTAYEVSADLAGHMLTVLREYPRLHTRTTVCVGDFVEAAADLVMRGERPFTHAILNPPYKKISTSSQPRLNLRRAGIETVNLYSGFLALATALLKPRGQLVAIVPRSFCNGPYYKPFREFLFDHAALHRLHVFDSRRKPFGDDAVLQETVILHLERDGQQGGVTISHSTDQTFSDLSSFEIPFEQMVQANDGERFIHIPRTSAPQIMPNALAGAGSLADLGLAVSTGPVVDFRLSDLLRAQPESGTVPLLYPAHFRGLELAWPKKHSRKPNAIIKNDASSRWLLPSGWYTVVRRFSAKEERRRVVAGIIDPQSLDGAELIGVENHLNIFHAEKRGTSELTAKGLATFLNTTLVDEYFRSFGGHTQVNAADLRKLTYPTIDVLQRLGLWANTSNDYSQEAIDAAFAGL